MTGSAIASTDQLWQSIRREAEAAIARDPIYGRSAAIVHDQPDLGSALAVLIGQRIGMSEADRTRFTRAASEAFVAVPALVDAAACDLQAIVRRDPAITGFLPPLLNFKGYVALEAWR